MPANVIAAEFAYIIDRPETTVKSHDSYHPQCPHHAVSPDVARTLRIAFLGFNPLGDGFDGRGLIDRGADHVFSSLDALGARRIIRRRFPVTAGAGDRKVDLRICGYSFGGWTALQLAHELGPRFRVRLGLLDPVCTFRRRDRVRLLPLSRAIYARRPANAVVAVNIYQTKGLVARFDQGRGMRMPYPANWFASQPIDGFENIDRSNEVSWEAGHIEVAEKYGPALAAAIYGDGDVRADRDESNA